MADFEFHKYQTNAGNVFKIKCDDDNAVLEVSGDEPTAALTENMSVKISKGKRAFGIQPRYALYKRPIGSANTEGARFVTAGQAYKKIPVFTLDRWDELDSSTAPDVTVDTVTFTYVDKVAESVR